jgi:hypothetical protein
MDEPPGAQRCQDQHQRGAQDNQEDAALRAILDLGENLRLVEAKADNKSPGCQSKPANATCVVLEQSVIKDNTLMPGEWYDGQLHLAPPTDQAGGQKT